MSLFSILNNFDSQSASSTSSWNSTSLLQQITALQSSGSSAGTTTASSTSALPAVLITMQAQRAAADAADAKQDATALADNLHKAFAAAKTAKKTLDLTSQSGRALSLVALNQDGSFSTAQVAQAKTELRNRDRASAMALISGGALTADSLATYSKTLLAARQSMSSEERQLRDADPKLR